MTLSLTGLLVILVAWLLQLYFIWQGSKELSTNFIILYAVGALLISWGDFSIGQSASGLLNLLVLATVGTLIWKTMAK